MLSPRVEGRRLVAGMVVLAVAVSPRVQDAAGATPGDMQTSGLPGRLLRIAESEDGLSFTDTREVFLENASAPDLVRLPDQDLLAIFDYHDPDAPQNPPVLAVCRSSDDGASWSGPYPIRNQGTPSDGLQLRFGTLVVMPTGLVRMFCLGVEPSGDPSHGGFERYIASAVTRNGLDYVMDPAVRIPIQGSARAQPTAAWAGGRLELFITARREPGEAYRTGGTVFRYSSLDGRLFEPTDRLRLVGLIGSIVVPEKHRFRLYFSYRNEILSMGSLNGIHWGHEPGVRLKNASDAAVIQLRDGRFWMLYVAPATDVSLELLLQRVLAGPEDTGDAGSVGSDGALGGPDVWKPFTFSSFDSELGANVAVVEDDPALDPFAPLPD